MPGGEGLFGSLSAGLVHRDGFVVPRGFQQGAGDQQADDDFLVLPVLLADKSQGIARF
jgi:hypothetical protein